VPDDRIDLNAVERALDRSWFDEARRTLGPTAAYWCRSTAAYWCRSTDEDDRALAAYFGWLIDRRNLLEAVRARQEGDRAAVAVFAEGGIDVDRTLFDRVLRAADWAAVSDLISGTRYGSVSIVGEGGHPPVTQAERQLTSALIRRLDGLARPNPLGFALVIGSFERKANEVATLRMIAQGVAYGMAPEEIRALVAAAAY
jgi:vacuolar-type H+-ATPase subunit C/Vma6